MDHTTEIIFGVLGLLATLSIGFTGIAYKVFSASIDNLKESIEKLESGLIEQRKINERLETRINANQVSIAKFDAVVKAIEKIESKLDEMQKIILKTIKNGSS